MTRLLITGGAGFIGTNLITYLRTFRDYSVTVLDDESVGDRRHVEPLGASFVHGDIRDESLLRSLMRQCDVVVHLAADTRVIDSIEDPQRNFEVNALGSLRVLIAARDAGVGRVIAASTGGAILGEVPPPVHEDMNPRPLSPYGASKLAMEGYLSAFAGAYGLGTVALRFSNVYGPHSYHKGSVVAGFLKRVLDGEELVIYGDGEQVRDFLFVGDLVQAVQKAIESRVTGVFQLGSGRPTRINDLVADIRRATAHPELAVRYVAARRGEVLATWCDVTRARRELGFEPATSLTDGLARTWAWFEAERARDEAQHP